MRSWPHFFEIKKKKKSSDCPPKSSSSQLVLEKVSSFWTIKNIDWKNGETTLYIPQISNRDYVRPEELIYIVIYYETYLTLPVRRHYHCYPLLATTLGGDHPARKYVYILMHARLGTCTHLTRTLSAVFPPSISLATSKPSSTTLFSFSSFRTISLLETTFRDPL